MLPDELCTETAIDVCGPFPTGEYVVSLNDFYSKCPKATTPRAVASTKILEWFVNFFSTKASIHPKIWKGGEHSIENKQHLNGMSHEGWGERVRIGGCQVTLSNFLDWRVSGDFE